MAILWVRVLNKRISQARSAATLLQTVEYYAKPVKETGYESSNYSCNRLPTKLFCIVM
jgi:hypothetical protein